MTDRKPVTPDAEALPTAAEVAAARNGRPFLCNMDGIALHEQAEQSGWTMQSDTPPGTFGYYRKGHDHAVVLHTTNGLGLVRIEKS